MTADPSPLGELVPHVQCCDCGALVPLPAGLESWGAWRCYDCGWGSE